MKRGYVPHMPYKRKRGQKERKHIKKNILMRKIKDGWLKEQTHGIIDLENCLQDSKRR
jgi:hypothetical protein